MDQRSQSVNVNGSDNPADNASRGVKLDELLQNERWLKGPCFLWKDDGEWPESVDVPPITEEDPAVRQGANIYVTAANEKPMESLVQRYSSWWRLVRAFGWLSRFKEYLQMKVFSKKNESTKPAPKLELGNLKVDELEKAQRNIVWYVQRTSFPEIFTALRKEGSERNQKDVKRNLQGIGSSLYQLNPMLKDELIVVGGRLKFANIDEENKHPMILPSKHHVADLVIRHYHELNGHMGQESVLTSLREKFWVLKGRASVRRVIRSCVDCQRRKKPACKQLMADLPVDRVKAYDPPFTYVGVDFFGPIEVKQRRSRVKRYGCTFTCLNTRAVHIEIAHTLNTDSMLNLLRRFVSLRGCPRTIRSDCGTNFTKGDKELAESIEEWNRLNIENFCSQRGIDWIFNPPGASHMGGSWERMIRSVRQVLNTLLKEQIVGDEVLSTILAEVTNILNSRPLTRNSSDPNDPDALTPNHLLHLRPGPSLPPGVFVDKDQHTQRQWRQAQFLANLFWKRWTREYLPQLQRRQKWNEVERNLKVDDIVLLTDENFPRGQWLWLE